MNANQRKLRDAVISGRLANAARLVPPEGTKDQLLGPFNPWIYAPEVGLQAAVLGEKLRCAEELPERLRDLAILTVAGFWDSSLGWSAHLPLVLEAGLTEEDVHAAVTGETPGTELHDEERVACEIVRNLLVLGALPDELYEEARNLFSAEALVLLVLLTGYYTLVAFTVNAFDVPGLTAEAQRQQPGPGVPRFVANGKRKPCVTLFNEFATCVLSVSAAGYRPRLVIEIPESGETAEFDPLELAEMCRWQDGQRDDLVGYRKRHVGAGEDSSGSEMGDER